MRYPVLTALAATATLLAAGPAVAAEGNVDLPRYPSVSPDGSSIVFSWRGDLWKVDADGGHAVRLTSHPGNDLRSAWSADGERIAFDSGRDGFQNIHMMDADGTDIRQVTNIDRPCTLMGFGTNEDGAEVLTFHAALEGDTYRSMRPYMVSSNGGDLVRVHDAFGSTPSVSRDSRLIAFTRGGYFYGWPRRLYRGAESMDVWLYNRATDEFKQITDWKGHDGDARWAGDRKIIFMSDKWSDNANLYIVNVGGNVRNARRLTSFTDDPVQSFDVSADGSTAVLAVWDTLYTLDLKQRTAKPKALTISANEDEKDNYKYQSVGNSVSEAALSPDGKVMAMVAYGEVYVRNLEDRSPTRRVTESHAREKEIAWSPDGLKLYFVSDKDGTDSIYAATVDFTRGEVKDAFDETMNPKEEEEEEEADEDEGAQEEEEEDDDDAAPAAPAADDGISGEWTGNAQVPDMGVVPFTLTLSLGKDGSVSGSISSMIVSIDLTGTWDAASSTLKLSGANEEISVDFELTVDGESMSGTGAADGMVAQVTATRTAKAAPAPAEEGQDDPVDEDEEDKPRKNGKKEKKKLPKELDPERWRDAMAFNIEPLIATDANERMPAPSPDGTKLAFKRGRGDIAVLDLESGEVTTLAPGWDMWVSWRWSPDSRHLAYAMLDMDFNRDIFIVPADGSAEAVNVTRHPDIEDSPRWSADGKILAFTSDRVNDEADVWMVYLDRDLEALTRNELEAYYEEAAKSAKKRKPLEIEVPEDEEEEDADDEAKGEDDDDNGNGEDEGEEESEEEEAEEPEPLDLNDAYLRLRRITRLSGSEGNLELTPGGDRFIFTGDFGGSGLFSVKWDGSDRKRLRGAANVQHVNLTGDKVVYVSGGQAGTIGPGGGSSETVAISDSIRIDLQKQASQKFIEAARVLGEMFYHPTMKDLDWAALTQKYHTLAMQTRTASEFNYIGAYFLGELSGSHLGIRASDPRSPNARAHGRLGVGAERTEAGMVVTSIVPRSPASKGPMALKLGDVITGIEGEPIGIGDTVESLLEGRVGQESLIDIRRSIEATEDEEARTVDVQVLLTPTSYGAEAGLKYESWRNSTAKLVEEWSDGRLGYIHIQGMSQPSLDVFERDLFAACDGKDGLIIDVRNNGGGWTTDRLMSSIMVEPHAYTIPRGADQKDVGHYPRDRLFIQRYMLPINMLCNEKSFSNAEICSHAFKTYKRGTLVGQSTWGGVISTGGFGLIDGTFVRLPFRGWYLNDGSDMENNGCVPDIIVDQTPEAESRNDDEQLRAAVDDLMKRLDVK